MTTRTPYTPDAVPPLFAREVRISELATPAQHDNEVALEAAAEAAPRRSPHCEAILALLRTGPKTGDELAVVTRRYSARVCDLRKVGFRILSSPLGGGGWLFTLQGGGS